MTNKERAKKKSKNIAATVKTTATGMIIFNLLFEDEGVFFAVILVAS